MLSIIGEIPVEVRRMVHDQDLNHGTLPRHPCPGTGERMNRRDASIAGALPVKVTGGTNHMWT